MGGGVEFSNLWLLVITRIIFFCITYKKLPQYIAVDGNA